jgi:hypothetical protein
VSTTSTITGKTKKAMLTRIRNCGRGDKCVVCQTKPKLSALRKGSRSEEGIQGSSSVRACNTVHRTAHLCRSLRVPPHSGVHVEQRAQAAAGPPQELRLVQLRAGVAEGRQHLLDPVGAAGDLPAAQEWQRFEGIVR